MRAARRLFVVFGAMALFVGAGCGDGEDVTDVTGGNVDTGGGAETCTTAAECDDGDECTEDSCGATGLCAHTPMIGPNPIYSACEKDCDCDTGFCYDEGYLSPWKWCTKDCGGVAEGCGTDAENVCLIFSGAWVDAMTPAYTTRAICAPVCQTDEDCTALDAGWDGCTTNLGGTVVTDTEGNDHTVSLRKTCTKLAE